MRGLLRNTAGEVMRGQSLWHTKDSYVTQKNLDFFPLGIKDPLKCFKQAAM